jgi:hypothetical protein
MTMMGSSLRCWRNSKFSVLAFWTDAVLVLCLSLLPHIARADPQQPEVSLFQLERQADGIYLAASVQFELAPAVEDALQKGVPLFFVAEVDIYQTRWYWYARRVLSAQRHLRLAFQPLTRRWRVSTSPGTISNSGLGLALHQNFDSLAEAVASVKRFSRWKIAETTELEPEKNHYAEFRFRLDVSQLPRPFQIGALGQSDWTLATSATRQVPAVESK